MYEDSMATKKKYTVLDMQQRLDVLKDLQETSLSKSNIAKKYGVAIKTIHRINKNAVKINTFADKSKRDKKRRKIIEPLYNELDKRLIAWFIERKTLGDHLTDALMLAKASELKNNLPSCSRFKVSTGWLCKFKKRHAIRLLHVDREKASADQDDASKFINDFKQLIQEENISLENIYNMDESGLLWKALPTKTLPGDEEKTNSSYKIRKDRITIGLCANALGTHKMMPLIIYKYKNPRILRHETSLPVIYKSQINALMDRKLFLDWFNNHFKPSVLQYQNEKQISGKVILLLNNYEGHKISPETQQDEDFKIIYLPPNTSFIQPMDQGIIEKTKRLFRYKIVQRPLTYENGVTEFYKDYTLKNCIDILSKSWSEITENNIRNSWNKIIGPIISSNCVQLQLETDWQHMISTITGEECTEQNVIEFLSLCEEAERSEEHIAEGTVSEEEPPQGPPEMIYQNDNNEIVKNELRTIFDRLTFYSTRAPTCIQCIVWGLKIFFLGKEY